MAQEYKALLQYAHRMWGVYRRFAGGMSFEEYTGYRIPKRITQGSIRRLKRVIREAKGQGEIARRKVVEREKRARKNIDYFMRMIQDGYDFISGGNRFAKMGARTFIVELNTMIEVAIENNGVVEVGEGLSEVIEKYGKLIEKWAYAVIDSGPSGYFNTNRRWYRADAKGSIGRSRFEALLADVGDAIGVSNPRSFISFTL